jgi:hypothetical protein
MDTEAAIEQGIGQDELSQKWLKSQGKTRRTCKSGVPI